MRKKVDFLEDSEKIAADLFVRAMESNVTIDNDELSAKWEAKRNEIVQFYINKYVDVLIEHGQLFSDFNILSLAMMQRGSMNIDQLQQAKTLLQKQLEQLFQKAK